MLGEWIYPLVLNHRRVKDPAKITGMLLELENDSLVPLLTDEKALKEAVFQACDALESFEAASPPAAPQGGRGGRGGGRGEAGGRGQGGKPAKTPPQEKVVKEKVVIPHPNAKTRLCTTWVQRGYCTNGEKCNFAHGTLDMTAGACARNQAKVNAVPLGFRPIQVMPSKIKLLSPKAPPQPKASPAAPTIESPTPAPEPGVQEPEAKVEVQVDASAEAEAAEVALEVAAAAIDLAAHVKPSSPAAATGGVVSKDAPIDQWAARVLGFSSQFSEDTNGAIQILGQPKHYPNAGSNTGTWSAIPQSVERIEFVRIGLERPVHLVGVHVYETLNPGSVGCVRVASEAEGGEMEWVEAWSRRGDSAAATMSSVDVPSRIFSPPISAAATQRAISAIEIELDTSEWTEMKWSEIDAVRVVGHPADAVDVA